MPVSVNHNARRESAPAKPESVPNHSIRPVDLQAERLNARESQMAMLNVLEDFHDDRLFASHTNWAILNILEDFDADKRLLSDTTRAVINILDDLEEAKQVTEALNAQLEPRVTQLEAANNELEAFSYSVSHDLRAPLRAIDGFSRILLDEYASSLPDEARAYLTLVRDNTREMGNLVDGLLAFSRLSRLALSKQTVDPGKIVRQCLAEMQKEREGRQLEIVVGDLPSCQADLTLLKQVWTNLLSNALKYTRKQQAARIEIR